MKIEYKNCLEVYTSEWFPYFTDVIETLINKNWTNRSDYEYENGCISFIVGDAEIMNKINIMGDYIIIESEDAYMAVDVFNDLKHLWKEVN